MRAPGTRFDILAAHAYGWTFDADEAAEPRCGQLAPGRAAPRGHGAQRRRGQARDDHRRRLERPSALDEGRPAGAARGVHGGGLRDGPARIGRGSTRCASGPSATPGRPARTRTTTPLSDGDFRPKPIYEALQRYAAGLDWREGSEAAVTVHARVTEPLARPRLLAPGCSCALAGSGCSSLVPSCCARLAWSAAAGRAVARSTTSGRAAPGGWAWTRASRPSRTWTSRRARSSGSTWTWRARSGGAAGDQDARSSALGFDELIDAVAAHRVDAAISALPVIPERTQDVRFSDPYVQAGVVLAVQQAAGAIGGPPARPGGPAGGGGVGQPGRCRGAAAAGGQSDRAASNLLPKDTVTAALRCAGRGRGRRGDRGRDQPGAVPAGRAS